MKRTVGVTLLILLCTMFLFGGCSLNGDSNLDGTGEEDAMESGKGYLEISQEAAKEMMDSQEVVILDVREQDEFDSGHIVDAVLLPVGSISEATAAEVIPEKDSVVLVYCRSGNRSKTASAKLVELGYTNVYEFGGIKTWPYEIEE